MAYTDQLTQIVQANFPFNHIMLVSLLQRTPNMASQQNIRDYKEKYFFMITFAPGVNQQDGNRTYDFKSGKITQKFATREIAGLAEILYQCAIGNDINVLPYAKFSRSAQNQKSLSIWVTYKSQNVSGQQRNTRSINISCSMDKTKMAISLSADQAFGISKILTKLFEKACDLEIDNFQSSPFQDNSYQNQNNNFQHNIPQQQLPHSSYAQNTNFGANTNPFGNR